MDDKVEKKLKIDCKENPQSKLKEKRNKEIKVTSHFAEEGKTFDELMEEFLNFKLSRYVIK